MCQHQHKKTYINGLSTNCTLTDYFAQAPKQGRQYPNLPIDAKGKCIFHSADLKWKRANNCGERFWELFQVMAADENLEDIDFREFALTGLSYESLKNYLKGSIPISQRELIIVSKLHIKKPLRMQGSQFYDNVLFQDIIFEEAVDFDEAIFKEIVTIERCNFKGMVSFVHDTRFEHHLIVEDSIFESPIDFHETVAMQHLMFNRSIFESDALFIKFNQVGVDLICSFTAVTFNAYTSFSNAGFNSSLAFDSCHFGGETHFENTAFRKRFQLLKPTIADKVFFKATKPGVKLFENAVDFEVTKESFQDMGQLIFENVNLFNFDATFKSQLKELELHHKVDLRDGCLLYRTAIERRFPYTRFNRIIVDDISRALGNYFKSLHQRSLQVDISRDLKAEEIKIIFHTEESMTIPELENLIYQTKEQVLEFLVEPKTMLKKVKNQAIFMDHFLTFKNLWERYVLALNNQLLEEPLLEMLMTADGKVNHEQLKELFNITINIHTKNLVQNSQIEAKGNIHIGDLNQDFLSKK